MVAVFFAVLISGVSQAQHEAPPLPDSRGDIMQRVMRHFPDVNHEAVLGFIRDEFPQELHEFRELSLRHVGEAVDLMTHLVRESLDLIEAKRHNPERYEQLMRQRRLHREAFRLAEICRNGDEDDDEDRDEDDGEDDEDERQGAEEELRDVLEEIFEIKQGMMKAELEHMEKELDRLRGLIERRDSNRDRIIERRLTEMVGDSENLEW